MRNDEELIVWYRGILDTAKAQLELVEQGWRFERVVADQARVDITDEVAARELQTVETMERLIKMYEARRQ